MLVGTGAIRYHVAADDERVVYLIRGGYFPYFANPGETTFWAQTEAKSEVTKDLYHGDIYYLRGTITVGIGVGRPNLEFVAADFGQREIQKLKLLPPSKRSAH